MTGTKRFKVKQIKKHFYVLQFCGLGNWKKRGKPHPTRITAKVAMQCRIDAMGETRSKGRPWAV